MVALAGRGLGSDAKDSFDGALALGFNVSLPQPFTTNACAKAAVEAPVEAWV